MMLNILLALCVAGGAIAGFGVYLLTIQFLPSTPALGPALRRLHPAPEAVVTLAPPAAPTWSLPIQLPYADLAILGRTPQRHILSVGLSAGLGLLIPLLLSMFGYVAGLRIPITIPIALTLLLALGAAALAHGDMRARARSARAEFIRALCTYATLTAHQVRSGHGAVEAMERSAGICDGWPYAKLRTTLLTAQLQMSTPWDELKSLATEIELVELASFADIMRSAGTDGAQVYQTLRAQAASLRDQIRVRALEVAKTKTSKLDIPATLLIIILLTLIVYPLMAGLFNQS